MKPEIIKADTAGMMVPWQRGGWDMTNQLELKLEE